MENYTQFSFTNMMHTFSSNISQYIAGYRGKNPMLAEAIPELFRI